MERNWHTVGKASELRSPGDRRTATLNGEAVVVINAAGELYAVSAVCPHQEGSIADGTLEGSILVCPGHRYGFDLTSGRCTDVPGYQLRSFPLRVESGLVQVLA